MFALLGQFVVNVVAGVIAMFQKLCIYIIFGGIIAAVVFGLVYLVIWLAVK